MSEGHDPAVAKKLKLEANLEAGRQTFEKVGERSRRSFLPPVDADFRFPTWRRAA